MFCGKCGQQNDDQALFCMKCGAKLPEFHPTPDTAEPVNEGKKKNSKMIIISSIIVVLLATVAIVLGIKFFGGRSYEDAAEDFAEACFECDYEELFELLPKQIADYALENFGYTKDDLDELSYEAKRDLHQYYSQKLGNHLSFTSKIAGCHDIVGSDFMELRDSAALYGVKISKARFLNIQLTIKGDDDEEVSFRELTLVKIKNSWYVYLEPDDIF